MNAMQRQGLYHNQLRSMYGQISKKRSKGEEVEESRVEDLSALGLRIEEKEGESLLERLMRPAPIENESLEKEEEVKPFVFETVSKEEALEEEELVEKDKDVEVKPFVFTEVVEEEETEGKDREFLEARLAQAIMQNEQSFTETASPILEEDKKEMFAVKTVGMLQRERMLQLQDVLPSKSFKEIMLEKEKEAEAKLEIVPFVHEDIVVKEEVVSSTRKEKKSIFQRIAQKFTKNETTIDLNNSKNKSFRRVKALFAAAFVLVTGAFSYSKLADESEEVSCAAIVHDFSQDREDNISSLEQVASASLVEANVIMEQESMACDSMDEEQEDRILLGKSIHLSEGSYVYQTEQDAYLGENAFTSYYSSQDERVVIGVLVENESGMTRVCADSLDANSKINHMLDQGGKVVSVLTANKNYALSNYDGTETLSANDLNNSVEGWYSVCSIQQENVKTLCK